MKNIKKFLALALVIVSVLAVAAPALAATKMYVTVPQGPGNTVNVRNSAGGSVVTTLTHGSAVNADAASGGYNKVSFYNPKTKTSYTGYIQSTFLTSTIPSNTAWITYYGTVDYKLTTGTKYEGCKKLQHDLNTLLKLSLVEDGICGQNTVNAIKQFQGAYNLTQDGVAGNMTKEYLHKLTK